MLRTLMRGRDKYFEEGNDGIMASELGASNDSSQRRPHILATSSGSHLGEIQIRFIYVIEQAKVCTKISICNKYHTHCNSESSDWHLLQGGS